MASDFADRISTGIKENWAKTSEWLNEQQWFQELRGKWEELDPQSRTYLKFASIASVALLFVGLVLSSMWGVYKLKREFNDKSDLLVMLQSANDELRRLREANASASAGAEASGPWSIYLETLAVNTGIDKATLTVGAEKPGKNTDSAKESLLDVSLKHVSIKQVVRLANALENGQRPAKLRNLVIETGGDPNGYLDATLSVSGFTLASQ